MKYIETCSGKMVVTNNSKILIHEHIFNLFPHNKKKENSEYTLSLLKNLSESGYEVIVDLTPYSKIWNYYDIIENSPIHIVMCAGYYTGKYVKQSSKKKSSIELFNELNLKFEKGIGRNRIKPGIIKIATNSEKLLEYEVNIFTAAAQVSIKHKIPIAVHSPRAALYCFDFLTSLGVPANQIMIAHTEAILSKNETLFREVVLKILSSGGYVQFSDFGSPTSKKRKYLTALILELSESTYFKHILISNDFNWRWKNGKPYSKKGKYSFTDIEIDLVPHFIDFGIDKNKIIELLTTNAIDFIVVRL